MHSDTGVRVEKVGTLINPASPETTSLDRFSPNAKNVYNGKNGIPHFCFIFKMNNKERYSC
jgi:hypothetical protein